ncbi:MAG TPA: hypothetical protein VFQ53_34055 [Kofleriaceae bacterium]|nr:hypothetical protein [Kofleriaceae bacterium]
MKPKSKPSQRPRRTSKRAAATEPASPSPSPLARAIYAQLVAHVRAHQTSITYGELAAALSASMPIHPRSSKLHAALGEVTDACRERALPILPAIVCRNDTHRPSDGYYKVAHPRARSYKSQRAAWEHEHARVLQEHERFPATL